VEVKEEGLESHDRMGTEGTGEGRNVEGSGRDSVVEMLSD